MTGDFDPLFGEAPEQIPLPRAPLEWVIAQIKYSPLLAVNDPAHLAKFQEALRQSYPFPEKEQSVGLKWSGEAVPETIWRFSDTQKHWRVSIHQDFVSLEAKKYSSRKEFIERVAFIVKTLNEIFKPAQMTRLGVRYLDRMKDEAYTNVQNLINPSLHGLAATSLFPQVHHSSAEASLKSAEGMVTLRWGKIPKGMILDASTNVAFKEDSWILDIDLADESAQDFAPARIIERTEKFSSRIYAIFRWAVTDDFIKYYGGTI